MSDTDRVLGLAATLSLGPGRAHVVTVPGVPWSKSRPRFTRTGRTYHAAEDKTAEHRTAIQLRSTVRQPFTGNVALVCLFYRPDRRRIDVDNLLKHVCDAANSVLWADDSQCTALVGILELDAVNPRTVIAVAPHASTLRRGTDHPGRQTITAGEPA